MSLIEQVITLPSNDDTGKFIKAAGYFLHNLHCIYLDSTTFFALPNELFECIFIYLSSTDLVYSFLNISHPRLNALIYRFISRINLSNASNQWLVEYLPHIQSMITAMQLNDYQLDTIFPEISFDKYPKLQCVHVYNIPNNNVKCLSYISLFKTRLSSLKIVMENASSEVSDHSYLTLLQPENCSLEILSLSNLLLDIYHYHIRPLMIKQLTVLNLCRLHDLFLLFEHLPFIEYVKIGVCELNNPEEVYNYDNIISSTSLSKQLHTIDLHISHHCDEYTYKYLELLILRFFISLKYLTLDIVLIGLLDVNRLEKFFKLKQFQFRIQMISSSYFCPLNMATFPTYSHVICYSNSQDNIQTLLSLPNVFDLFDQVSNNIINYRSNINNLIRLTRVKQIKLYDTKCYTIQFFKFIKQTFPNVITLEFFHYCYLADDLINDNNITIDSIRSLYIHASPDYRRIKRLLLLTPNIKNLSASYQTLLKLKNGLQDEDYLLQQICQQIVILRIHSMNKGDEMKSVFINATII
ncbi:unnamed protein product [Didymodactylos carnosus]|uniref:F-box domain-containing protein n=1 Tax=Didymodactylos carnosus TaxID=1234261 RepID=A0A814MK30_9BILA|nr:unnamed protein product [Didymodactylos carnosus]CAF1080549.1 unnamed protein product [Didymodactylos carnosus]CAF3674909.1 unnamed protein product [Didymodactylos carnosus]CAF3846522.1 unnamed protein product [Didymodactylos carnosus]